MKNSFVTANEAGPPPWVGQAIEQALAKIEKLLAAGRGLFLHATREGQYQPCEPFWWTSGFWPGILWQAYRYTRREEFREAARPADELLAGCFGDERFFRLHHDVGFQFLLTAVARYELTSEAGARQRGLLAASLLMSRFNLAGKFIRAWNVPGSEHLSIIDTMMNLPLLLWASQEYGDERFAMVARAHADTVLERVIRPDGSVPHIVKIGPGEAVLAWADGSQGYHPDSVWSRGQSWALYGFARLYHYTGEGCYLAASQRIADSYLQRLPADGLPPWDFSAPAPSPRDSSAAACAASGLLELAALSGKSSYREAALTTLAALHQQCATWAYPHEDGLLREGVEHHPAGRNVNTSLIYGDYYFLEGLLRASSC